MAAQPEFLFDFGSPNAYLAHVLIPGVEQRTGARFIYEPVLLGGIFKATGNRSPIESYAGVKNKLAHQMKEMARFIRKHDITGFRMNPHFPVNTLNLMRGAVAAQLEGMLMPYADTMFAAMWERGLKMDDPEVIGTVLAEAGLDAALLMRRAQDADVKARLVENTQRAVERGAYGAPTFFVGEEMFFGKDQLRDVEDELKA